MATRFPPITSPEVHDSLSTPSRTNTNSLITLQVGDRRFTIRAKTLTEESPVFSSLLSGKWADKQPDGTYFIDSDPSVFEHVLRYLRSSVLPVFYDRSKGHDYYLYTAVLQQAQYFQIDKLEKWISDKQYHQAVKVQRYASVEGSAVAFDETLGTDMEVEYHPSWKTEKVYVCPREIASHRGNPRACGRMCRNRQGEADPEFVDEEILKIVTVSKRVIFDHKMCFDG